MGREFDIRKEVVLEATPEQVWQAIATPEGQAAWLFPAEEPNGATVERVESTRFAVRTPEAPYGSFHAFEYFIEARDGGTAVLRFVHSGFLSDDWGEEYVDMTGQGWDMYLHTLAQYLKYFADSPATYIKAEAPAASVAPDVWALIEKGLGLTGPVTAGERVRLTPEGLEPIDGVVDYAPPGQEFLGVRSGDGLYRFHGRARLGMPVPVGHHIYSADLDAEHARQGWQGRLSTVFRLAPPSPSGIGVREVGDTSSAATGRRESLGQ